MWNLDVESLIQIVVFLAIIGVPVGQFIYRAFVKPVSDAEKQKRAGRGSPGRPRTLQQFLEEIQGGADSERPPRGQRALMQEKPAQAGMPRRKDAPPPIRGDLDWEVVEEFPPPLPPRASRPGPRPKRGAPRKPARPVAPGTQPVEGHAHLSLIEDRHLESAVARHVDEIASEGVARRSGLLQPETALPGDTAGASGSGMPRRKLPEGIGLREAMLGRIILGPPRSRELWRGAAGWKRPY